MLLSVSSSLYGLLASQQTIFHSDLPATYDAMVLCNNLNRMRLSVQMMTLENDDVARYRFFDDILQVRDEHKTIVERLRKHLEDKPQTKEEVIQLRQTMQEFETSLKTELQPEALGKTTEEGRKTILASQSKRFKTMSALAEKLQTECQRLTKEHTSATISKTQSALAIEQIIAASTIPVAVLLMVLLQKTVANPLQAIGIAAKQIATGDLDLHLSVKSLRLWMNFLYKAICWHSMPPSKQLKPESMELALPL